MVTLTGKLWDFYDDEEQDAEEGDIWLQAKLDAAGRLASAGRNTNFGYSGWFTGFVQAEGGRRRFLSWRMMFPEQENGYRKQADKFLAVFRIEECLKSMAELELVKVSGGWKFADDAAASERVVAHWRSWNSPPQRTHKEAQEIAEQMNNNPKTTSLRHYTAEEILARPESDLEKWMRLRGKKR